MISKSLTIIIGLAVLLAVSWSSEAASERSAADFYSSNSAENLIQVYEDPARREWQRPQEVVERLVVNPGDVIADIGAGTGYFSVLFARKTANNGKVYAVDIDRKMVEYVEQRSKNEGFKNISTILASPDDPLLPKNSVDLVFLCNTYMFIKDRQLYLSKLKDVLRPKGRLAVISYNRVDSPEGPPIHIRLSREKTVKEALEAGFVLDTEYFFLPYQHFLVFTKH